MKAKIQTMMKKVHSKMISNKMKEWVQKNIVNKAEEYAGINKNINEIEPDDINENELYKNTVAYVSGTTVYIEGSYFS